MAQPMDRTGLDRALSALGDVLAYRGEAYELCSSGRGPRASRDRFAGYERMPTCVGQRLANGSIVAILSSPMPSPGPYPR